MPCASAVAERVWPLSVTATFSPGVAVPQMGASVPLCKTMWSLKSAEGLTWARTASVKQSVTQRDARSESLFSKFINCLVGAFRFKLHLSPMIFSADRKTQSGRWGIMPLAGDG